MDKIRMDRVLNYMRRLDASEFRMQQFDRCIAGHTLRALGYERDVSQMSGGEIMSTARGLLDLRDEEARLLFMPALSILGFRTADGHRLTLDDVTLGHATRALSQMRTKGTICWNDILNGRVDPAKQGVSDRIGIDYVGTASSVRRPLWVDVAEAGDTAYVAGVITKRAEVTKILSQVAVLEQQIEKLRDRQRELAAEEKHILSKITPVGRSYVL